MPEPDVRYLLDTNMVRAILDGNASVTRKTLSTPATNLFLSAVAVEEMISGRLSLLNKAREGRSQVGITLAYEWFLETIHLVHRFQILNYTDADEERYRAFPAAIKRVGRQDCRIAAQALNHGLVVVTRNARHFVQVPDLQCADWTLTDEPTEYSDRQ